jgi:hypothetical protein
VIAYDARWACPIDPGGRDRCWKQGLEWNSRREDTPQQLRPRLSKTWIGKPECARGFAAWRSAVTNSMPAAKRRKILSPAPTPSPPTTCDPICAKAKILVAIGHRLLYKRPHPTIRGVRGVSSVAARRVSGSTGNLILGNSKEL